MKAVSSMFEQFTLGIEEEFQIVDPQTRELRSHVSEILEEGKMLLGEQVKPEMIQSMIEVGTGICKDIEEARTDITNLRGILSALVRKKGLEIVAAGTHPFSHWQDQKIFENARYELIVEENQMLARSLLTFGLHVHVGVTDLAERGRRRDREVVLPAQEPAHLAHRLEVRDVALQEEPVHRPAGEGGVIPQ